MSVDASAVARVVGVSTTFKDLRGSSALSLPQRLAIFAQGATLAVYAATKYVATSAVQVAERFGFGSPLHLIALQLFPPDGSGVGIIPVTFYPLSDHGSGEAATGDITPSGTQTRAASYRVKISEVLSELFVIPASASVTARCVLMYDAIVAQLAMPMIPSFTYGSVTASHTTIIGSSNGTCTSLSASGSPRPGTWLLTCTAAVTNGGVWSLTDPLGNVVATGLTMTPGAGGTTVITSNGLTFTLTDGSTDFGVGDVFTITVPATKLNLTSKWKGESANALYVEVVGDDYGTTFTMTQPSGGLANPVLDSALAQIGEVWESMLLNALNIEDETALDAINTAGELRWGDTVHRPFVAFTGVTHASVEDATAICSTRRTDRVNAQLVAPGSKNLPFVVAARQLAKIAVVANNNPPVGYATQRATGLVPGDEEDQWDGADRETAVKAGSSTIRVNDGVVCVEDVVTFYRPSGDPRPAYRHVVNIVKLQQFHFNLALAFEAPEWAAAPLIPNDQPTVNPAARKPKNAVTQANAIIDQLGLAAVLSDPAAAKKRTTASIDDDNPDRCNLSATVQLSGNSNVVDVTANFGFYFGASAVVG